MSVGCANQLIPTLDNRGHLERIDASVYDITELKQTEHELIEANIELKATLDNLKRTQAQLIQSEKMAALGQLIAGYCS